MAPVTALIFASGAVLMALEIVGSPVLAPVFGSSVFLWGEPDQHLPRGHERRILARGRLSKRWSTQALLNALLAVAGAFTLLLP